ncbi:MAG: sulfite exporter TauE/SafE family protein [Cytophagales bacterium]|nr:MAG: sulfite exporter TauE/SafE family protein [Cytophagales bacterium]
MIFITPFLIGLLSSMHCIGMCGPITLALPVRTNVPLQKTLKYLLYNTGRIATYAFLGAIIGVFGMGINLIGFQYWVSIISGLLIILSVVVKIKSFKINFLERFSQWLRQKLNSSFIYYFKKSDTSALFILGLLNGLLPCGMVYIAIIGAIALATPLEASFFMIFFGLGTLPIMMMIPLIGQTLSNFFKSKTSLTIPILTTIIGGMLIFRGINQYNQSIEAPHKSCVSSIQNP